MAAGRSCPHHHSSFASLEMGPSSQLAVSSWLGSQHSAAVYWRGTVEVDPMGAAACCNLEPAGYMMHACEDPGGCWPWGTSNSRPLPHQAAEGTAGGVRSGFALAVWTHAVGRPCWRTYRDSGPPSSCSVTDLSWLHTVAAAAVDAAAD